jgi:anti-sigma factor RsiW
MSTQQEKLPVRAHLDQQEIDAYLDGEFDDEQAAELRQHAGDCLTCKLLLESRQALFDRVRSARPAVTASPELRARIVDILEQGVAPDTPAQPTPIRSRPPMAASTVLRYAAMLAVIVGGAISIWLSLRPASGSSSFVQAAVQRHKGAAAGNLALQRTTQSHAELTAWFDKQLPFAFRLPVNQELDSGKSAKYQLVGGSVTTYRGQKAAYVAYRMQNEVISLLVTTTDQAIATGGNIVRAQSLAFHTTQLDGLEVISWSVHHLTYALVSNLTLPPGQSCGVCHADPERKTMPRRAQLNRALTASHRLLTVQNHQVRLIAARYVDRYLQHLSVGGDFHLLDAASLAIHFVRPLDRFIVDPAA